MRDPGRRIEHGGSVLAGVGYPFQRLDGKRRRLLEVLAVLGPHQGELVPCLPGCVIVAEIDRLPEEPLGLGLVDRHARAVAGVTGELERCQSIVLVRGKVEEPYRSP